MATLCQPEDKDKFVFEVTLLSHKKVQSVNIQGHPDETTVAVPLVSPRQVGEVISPNMRA